MHKCRYSEGKGGGIGDVLETIKLMVLALAETRLKGDD